MDFSYITVNIQQRIAFITLNRPEKKNALNDSIVAELTGALTELETDDPVKVIIIKAAGDVFSAGADLDYLQKFQNFSYEENLADSHKLKELFLKIYANKKIVIAQVEGHAIAGGCGLATICDFCFAVPEANFGYTEVKIGFIPALVSVFLLRKIKAADARELLLTGRLINAEQAATVGLINSVHEKNKINEWVNQFAAYLCNEVSSQSIAATKELLSKISSPELNEALDYAARMNAQARASDDCKKGIASFLSKEKIVW